MDSINKQGEKLSGCWPALARGSPWRPCREAAPLPPSCSAQDSGGTLLRYGVGAMRGHGVCQSGSQSQKSAQLRAIVFPASNRLNTARSSRYCYIAPRHLNCVFANTTNDHHHQA